MLGVDPRAFRIAWTVFLLAGLLWLLYLIRGVLFVFILAVLFAYVIWPLVAAAERLVARLARSSIRRSRIAALALVYPLLVGAAILIATLIIPQVAQQGAALVEKATGFAAKIQQGGLLEKVSAERGWSLPLLYRIQDWLLRHTGSLVPYLQAGARELLRYASNLWLVVLVPILAFFLLKDADALAEAVEAGAGENRAFVRSVFADLHDLLAQYMRALILLGVFSFVSHVLFFLIAGVPYALLLAALAGILEFIPLVGPLAAAAMILLTSWVEGYQHLVWILIFLGVWRLLQDYVNSPWLLGSGVELHPLLIIFGVLAGAELAGVAGMFLSVPTMAAVRILVRRSMAQARAIGTGSLP